MNEKENKIAENLLARIEELSQKPVASGYLGRDRIDEIKAYTDFLNAVDMRVAMEKQSAGKQLNAPAAQLSTEIYASDIKFGRFTFWEPRFDQKSPHSDEIIKGHPEYGSEIGIEFSSDDPKSPRPWIAIKVSHDASIDEVADAIELLSIGIRSRRFGTTGDEDRLGKTFNRPNYP